MKPDLLFAARSLADPGVLPATLQAMRELGRDSQPFDRERLDALLAVEERFQSLLNEDGGDVLARSVDSGLRDSDIALAQTIQRLFAEAAIGMQRFLRHREAWAPSAGPALLPRVTARAISAIHGYAKWGGLLGQPGKSVPWKQLHALYLLAEGEGCEQVPVALLPWNPTYKPTPQALYIQALLQDLLQGAGLTPRQLDIADGWLGAWCLDYRLDREYRVEDHLFHVDLAGGNAFEVVRPEVGWETVRYLRAEGLSRQLDRVRTEMREGRLYAPAVSLNRLPPEDHLAALSALERLKPSLTSGPGHRLSRREQASGSIVPIVVGIEPVIASLAGNTPDTAAASGWQVYTRSAKSVGLMADGGAAQPLDTGSLVALHDGDRRGWVIGQVVHRIRLGSKGTQLAGVEWLAERPCPVSFERKGHNAARAVLALGTDPTGRFDALLLKETDYGDGAQATLRLGALEYSVRLGRPALRGPGWVRARFFVESKR